MQGTAIYQTTAERRLDRQRPAKGSILWHPGNAPADSQAQQGAHTPTTFKYAQISMYWRQAKTAEQYVKDWMKKRPPDPRSPIHPSTTIQKELRQHSPASLRALFQLQSVIITTDSYQINPPRRSFCDQDRSSQDVLFTRPNFRDATNNLFPSCVEWASDSP